MTDTGRCPDAQRLQALMNAEVSAAEERRLSLHLDGCAACQRTLERFAGATGWLDPSLASCHTR